MSTTPTALPPTALPSPTPGQRLLTALALVAIGLLPMLPALLFGRFPRTHEGMRYEHLAALFYEAIQNGFLYPRWLPDLSGGHGYPTFVFYQPLFFYVAAIWQMLGLGAVLAVQAASATFCVIGCIGAYRVARGVGCPRPISIAVAAIFMITPFAYVNLYVRGDHTELAAMMLTPWPIALLLLAERRLAAIDRTAIPLALAGVAAAGIVLAHPGVALYFIPVAWLIAASRVIALRGNRGRWLLGLIASGLIALTLAVPYWQPILANARFVHLDQLATGAFAPDQHAVEPWRLLSNFWDFGTSAPRFTGKPIGMSFQLGLPHVILAVAGVCIGVRRPWAAGSAIAAVLLTLAMTTLALGLGIFDLPLLRMIQFPWRLLSVIAPLMLVLIAAGFASLKLKPAIAAAIAAVAVLASGGWYHAMFRPSPEGFTMTDGRQSHLSWSIAQRIVDEGVKALPTFTETFAGMDEFRPIWSTEDMPPRGTSPMITALDGEPDIRPAAHSTPWMIDADIRSEREGRVRIEQFYFPGWQVELNGQRIEDGALRRSIDANGRMIVPVLAGSTRLTAWYAGPPGGGWRLAGMLAGLAVAAGLLWNRRLTSSPSPETTQAL